jgi:hypothetical protein
MQEKPTTSILVILGSIRTGWKDPNSNPTSIIILQQEKKKKKKTIINPQN